MGKEKNLPERENSLSKVFHSLSMRKAGEALLKKHCVYFIVNTHTLCLLHIFRSVLSFSVNETS